MTRLHGIVPYLVTPMTAGNEVAVDVLARLVDDLIVAGVHGVSPLGSTGEVMYLTAAQRRVVVRTVVDVSGGRVPVVPGVAAFATHDAVDQAVEFVELGADALVAIRQHYFPVTEAGAIGYFTAIASAVDVPIVLYTNPGLLGADLSLDALETLAGVDGVDYVKDASGVTGRLLSIAERIGPRLAIFSASAHLPASVMRLGGVGWMSGPACAIPHAAVMLYDLCRAGRWDDAWELQRRIWPLNDLFQRHGLAACVKQSLTLRGYDVGPPIAPQPHIADDVAAELHRTLDAIDLATTGVTT